MSWKNIIKNEAQTRDYKEIAGQVEERSGYGKVFNEGGKTFYDPQYRDATTPIKIELTQEIIDDINSGKMDNFPLRLTQIIGSHGPREQFDRYLKELGVWPADLQKGFGGKSDVHESVEDAKNGDMTAYNALPLLDCRPESGHQIWQPNVKKGEAVCLAHQSRCKITW